MGVQDAGETEFGLYGSVGSTSGNSTVSDPTSPSTPGRRASNSSRSSSISGNIIPAIALQQAKVLAYRRRSCTSTALDSNNQGADLKDRTDSKASARTVSKSEPEVLDDLSDLKEELFLCKTSLLKECRALHKKLDWVITHNEKQDKVLSHMRNSFNRLSASSAVPNCCSATCKELRQVAANECVTTVTNQVTSHPTNGNFDLVSLDVPSKPDARIADEMRHHEPDNIVASPPRLMLRADASASSSWLKSQSNSSFSKFLQSRTRNRHNLLKHIWVFLEDPELVPKAQAYHRMMTLLVLVSCALMIAQASETPPLGRFTENVVACVVDGFLTTEILLRFAACPNRISFFVDIHNLIDVANGPVILLLRMTWLVCFSGMLPQPQETVHTLLNSFLPMLRLLRILRRFESAHLIFTALARASEVLPMFLYVLAVIITTFASILYGVEPRENIESLPDACWFALVTLSTVGYYSPVTPQGKFVAGTMIVMTAVYMAMPIGIVGKVFSEVWDDRTRLLLTQHARRRFKTAGYTPAEIPGMFLSFDRNADGVLSVAEFTEMMKEMQFDVSGKRVSELYKVFDSDGNGSVSDREFLETLFPNAAREIYGDSNSSEADVSEQSSLSGIEAPNRQSCAEESSEVCSALGAPRDPFFVPNEKEDVGDHGGASRPECSAACDTFTAPGEKDAITTANASVPHLPLELDFPSDRINHSTEVAAKIIVKAEAVVEAKADGHSFAVEGEPVQAIQISNVRLQSSSSNMGTHYMPAAVGYVASGESHDSSQICPAPIEMDGTRYQI